ncbi:MAG: hypothetical protein L0Z50_08750 [Verrucomicrobiales bacterium]|nr:hypothetical protein [Verrucomicrobiales bacterium]
MKSDPVQIETAIRELGSLRATEALDVLVPMLDYVAYEHRRSDSWFRTGQGDRYPAVTAVAQIGQPAVPALLKAVVDGDPDSVFASNARWTLVFIFKNDLDEGIRVIEAAAKDSQSARASARLRLAADHLRNTQRELSRPRS